MRPSQSTVGPGAPGGAPSRETDQATIELFGGGDPGTVNGGRQGEPAAIEWSSPGPGPSAPQEATIALDALEELEAERDKWRERAILWRERALAAELLAKELGAHLADVRANLEDLRAVVRAWAQEDGGGTAPPATPATGWRRYLARIVEGPARAGADHGLRQQP